MRTKLLATVATSLVLAGSVAHAGEPVLGAGLPDVKSSTAEIDLASLMPADATLPLRNVLALALINNPRLKSFASAERAAEAARLQAGARPNPSVGFELENFGGSGMYEGMDSAESTLMISQLVRLGGKRGKAMATAGHAVAVANREYEIARIETYATATVAFVDVLAAQERLALADRLVEVAEEIEAAVSARVRAGGALALEENRARVAVEGSKIEQVLADRSAAAERQKLASAIGYAQVSFKGVVGDLEAIADVLPRGGNYDRVVEAHPARHRWLGEEKRWLGVMESRKAGRVPDLDFMGGIRHDNFTGDNGFVVGVSMTLPAWDRNAGGIRESAHMAEQAADESHAATLALQRGAAVAYETVAGAHEEAVRLRDNVLPEAEAAAEKSRDAYEAGALQLTDVLDIQRTFFRLRLQYVNALARYHKGVADYERFTGKPFPAKSTDESEAN